MDILELLWLLSNPLIASTLLHVEATAVDQQPFVLLAFAKLHASTEINYGLKWRV